MRSRLPKRSAVVQVVLRGIALACSVATVCVALYASVRHDYAKEMIGAYVAVSTRNRSPDVCARTLIGDH